MDNKLWNRCCECGKIMPYLRPATRIGHKTKIVRWYYDYIMQDPESGLDPDYVCERCWQKQEDEK